MPSIRGQAGGQALFKQRGPAYMAEIGRKGGLAKARNHIKVVLTEIAGEIAELARGYAYTDRIADSISVGETEEKQDGVITISIIVDTSEATGAPEAPAYEYGSGLHSTKGPAEKYPIRPKNVDALAFVWEEYQDDQPPWQSPKFIGIGEGGKFMFSWVEHPGVEPRPFLKPAIDEMMPELKSRLGKAFKRGILETLFIPVG